MCSSRWTSVAPLACAGGRDQGVGERESAWCTAANSERRPGDGSIKRHHFTEEKFVLRQDALCIAVRRSQLT